MSLTIAGLTASEAEQRLAHEGPNRLPQPPRPSPWVQFGKQFTHVLALLLWVAAALALLAGMPALTVAIVVVVVLNAVFAFAQEHRADRSAERLHALLPTTVHVRRDDQLRTIDAVDLVRDDLVLLIAGDRIGADMRLTSAHSLSVDESLVTGESAAIHRETGARVMAGSFVVQGEAEAVVEAIGSGTTIAGISALTREAHRPPSPLTIQLNRVVRTVAGIAVATGTVLGVVGLLLGLDATEAFLLGVGVTVALVPEGLLPTVTLSLARGAQLMADRRALVRRLDAVETLGATTFICADKTGTLTQNRMAVVDVWTPRGAVTIEPDGYAPTNTPRGAPLAVVSMSAAAESAVRCVAGRSLLRDGTWVAEGDPMESAIHCWALGTGWQDDHEDVDLRQPFTADRLLSSVVVDGISHVLGAPESVVGRLSSVPADTQDALESMTNRGRRVVAVARRPWDCAAAAAESLPDAEAERGLELMALVGLEDPPRPDVAKSLQSCRDAAIRVAMLTGDHPGTAAAIAREVGLLRPGGVVLNGQQLPEDDHALAGLLDCDEGAVVARVTPAGKLRIARCLRDRGHVVAMTGDGVNDAPALREADVGVAMGASGSDVAREAADLVLLDDNFATIVTAIELGRATFANVRRFLTYHLTDNIAELAPFAAWALTGGQLPLAISVLQVLALDIGTDILPALGLGAEPPSRRVMRGAAQAGSLIDGTLLRRAFGVLGPVEAVIAMAAFVVVLRSGGWSWGDTPPADLLAVASGTTFAVIAVAQMANALACRSASLPVWRLHLTGNRFVLTAIATEAVLLLGFVGIPWLADLLGGGWPSLTGWFLALAAAAALIVVDGAHKTVALRRRGRP